MLVLGCLVTVHKRQVSSDVISFLTFISPSLLPSVAKSHTLLPSLSGLFSNLTPHDLPLPLDLLSRSLYPSLLSVHLSMYINLACMAGTYYSWYLTHPHSLLYISGSILLWHCTHQLWPTYNQHLIPTDSTKGPITLAAWHILLQFTIPTNTTCSSFLQLTITILGLLHTPRHAPV